jgi:hypothetical protein
MLEESMTEARHNGCLTPAVLHGPRRRRRFLLTTVRDSDNGEDEDTYEVQPVHCHPLPDDNGQNPYGDTRYFRE